MKFTILGSSGFIGSALSSHLKSQQIECVDLDLRTEEISDKSLGHVIYAIGEPNFKEKPIQSVDAHVLKLEKFLEKALLQIINNIIMRIFFIFSMFQQQAARLLITLFQKVIFLLT